MNMRLITASIFLLLLLALAGQAQAEACSYREGIMALQQGNQVRGLALLRMASRDGDRRAQQYLASLSQGDGKPVQLNPVAGQPSFRLAASTP